MGVPSFCRWLLSKYPKVFEDVNPNINNKPIVEYEYDNLYLDMNSIIHPCFHPDDDDSKSSPPTTFEDVFQNIFDYIDLLVSIVKPRNLLYMAIDGVAPRAKMNQQRSRRFKTARDDELREAEEERLRKQFEMEGKPVLPKQHSHVSDSNIITPGTEFMHQLSQALKTYISSRIASNALWKGIRVILSNANVPGEGEHKIITFIRKQRCLPHYDPNTRHCLYGSDADLIMLGLATHEPHFSILREDVFHHGQLQHAAAKPFKLLHIWLLREYLELDMKIEDPPKSCTIDFERIVDDFIFICFFAGNDFLPHMPSLNIHEGAIDLLMTVYKEQFNKLGGYLVDINRIGEKHAAFVKLSRVEKFILMVGTYEEKIFKKRSGISDKKLRRLVSDYEQSKQEEQKALDNESSSDCALVIKNSRPLENLSHSLLNNVSDLSDEEILRNTKDLKDELNRCIREKGDLFKSGEFLIDKIKLGSVGYKERYYKEKFSVEGSSEIEHKRKEIVQKYTEGLLWVLQYYFSGVASWTWFYPYHYGPFTSDLKGMGQVNASFEKGVPFLQFDQLLSVLPPRSAYALPQAYAELMLDEQSSIHDMYPQNFEIDIEGKRFMWQGICKVPYIDERRLLAETRELKKGLSESEAKRNMVKVDSLFVKSSSKLAEKICSLSLESNKSDTSTSDGIGGIISLCHEGIEKSLMLQNEDSVFCVNYELPADSNNHIPHLLSGVNFPDKTIFEGDIMETVLWHELQQYSRPQYSRFENCQNQDNWRGDGNSGQRNGPAQRGRTFLLNAPPPPDVAYKGAGVGWGSASGRGKQVSGVAMVNEKMSSFSPFHKQHKDSGSYNHHQQRLQSETRPFGRGRGGRLQPNSNCNNNGYTWRAVSSSTTTLRPQWNDAKDQSRW